MVSKKTLRPIPISDHAKRNHLDPAGEATAQRFDDRSRPIHTDHAGNFINGIFRSEAAMNRIAQYILQEEKETIDLRLQTLAIDEALTLNVHIPSDVSNEMFVYTQDPDSYRTTCTPTSICRVAIKKADHTGANCYIASMYPILENDDVTLNPQTRIASEVFRRQNVYRAFNAPCKMRAQQTACELANSSLYSHRWRNTAAGLDGISVIPHGTTACDTILHTHKETKCRGVRIQFETAIYFNNDSDQGTIRKTRGRYVAEINPHQRGMDQMTPQSYLNQQTVPITTIDEYRNLVANQTKIFSLAERAAERPYRPDEPPHDLIKPSTGSPTLPQMSIKDRQDCDISTVRFDTSDPTEVIDY